MKKIILILFLLACTFVHLACAPIEEPRDYTLKIEKYAAFTTERYIDPLASYPSPDGKALYHIRWEGTPQRITYTLSVVDLQSGEARDIRAFGDAYSAAGGGSQSGFYYNSAQWDGDTLSFIMVDTNGIGTKFHYNTKTEEWTEERGISYSSASCYTPEENEAIALMYHNLPTDATIQDTTVVGQTLYQTFIQDDKKYYRSLDLTSKRESVADITDMKCTFYGSFLLCNGEEPGTKDLYRLENGRLCCVASQLPSRSPYLLIRNFNEFVITNSGFQKCFYIKDNVVNPLTVTAENPFQHITFEPERKLECIGCHGTTLYYLATENVGGVTYYYLLKGEIVPSIL